MKRMQLEVSNDGFRTELSGSGIYFSMLILFLLFVTFVSVGIGESMGTT